MKTINVILLSLLFFAVPVAAQDTAMVKKPLPDTRVRNQMPTRQGKGTAQPMPSPRYRSRMVPMPRDTNRNRRDTIRKREA